MPIRIYSVDQNSNCYCRLLGGPSSTYLGHKNSSSHTWSPDYRSLVISSLGTLPVCTSSERAMIITHMVTRLFVNLNIQWDLAVDQIAKYLSISWASILNSCISCILYFVFCILSISWARILGVVNCIAFDAKSKLVSHKFHQIWWIAF